MQNCVSKDTRVHQHVANIVMVNDQLLNNNPPLWKLKERSPFFYPIKVTSAYNEAIFRDHVEEQEMTFVDKIYSSPKRILFCKISLLIIIIVLTSIFLLYRRSRHQKRKRILEISFHVANGVWALSSISLLVTSIGALVFVNDPKMENLEMILNWCVAMIVLCCLVEIFENLLCDKINRVNTDLNLPIRTVIQRYSDMGSYTLHENVTHPLHDVNKLDIKYAGEMFRI